MRVSIIFLLAICIFTSCDEVITEENYTDLIELKNPPIITFDNETFDFGTIIDGDQVTHKYKFTNTGNGPLVLSAVNKSCGCTIAKNWPRTPIAPGESSYIEVVYNSEGRAGQTNKTITVVGNTKPNTTKLKLIGKVVGPTDTNENK